MDDSLYDLIEHIRIQLSGTSKPIPSFFVMVFMVGTVVFLC